LRKSSRESTPSSATEEVFEVVGEAVEEGVEVGTKWFPVEGGLTFSAVDVDEGGVLLASPTSLI
jgi:hypothetical protein